MSPLRPQIALPLAALALALAPACGGDDAAGPDAGPDPGADAGGPGPGEPDAGEPAEFDGLELRLSPENPIPGFDFDLYVRAVDTEGELYEDYNAEVTVEASEGELEGARESQPVSFGTAFLELRFEDELEDVTLTVTDDDDSDISASTEPFDILFEGDAADPGDVAINEINWYGPLESGGIEELEDVWIEIRNISGGELNVSQWHLEGAGIDDQDVFLFSDTVLADGEQLVVGNFDGIIVFGFVVPSSLTGVPNTQLHEFQVPLELPDEGAEIALRDVEGTAIDTTPDPDAEDGWAAGIRDDRLQIYESMQRRDDLSGGGYGDGSDPSQWYTWNRGGRVQTTNEDSPDLGTPSAENSDPDGAMALPYETAFEVGEPRFELLSSAAELRHIPPDGAQPRDPEGERVLTTDTTTTGYGGRPMRTVDCVEIDPAQDENLELEVHGMISAEASEEADLRLRHVVEWYEDSGCEISAGNVSTQEPATTIVRGGYREVLFDDIFEEAGEVPHGASHAKFRLEIRREGGEDDDRWAGDEFEARLVSD